jgi:hypothetical protein
MINHLEEHQHAFIDENSIVINVAIFNESAHDSQLLNDIKNSIGADDVVCCCTFGIAYIGGDWTGQEFRSKPLYLSWVWDTVTKQWNAPIPMPIDGDFYIWNEESLSWDKELPLI